MCLHQGRSPAYVASTCGKAEAEAQSMHAEASDVCEGFYGVGGGRVCCCIIIIIIIIIIIARKAGRIVVPARWAGKGTPF